MWASRYTTQPADIIPPGATTAADGTYTVNDVLPGSYEVQFAGLAGSNLASAFYGGASTLGAATKVTVSSGATTPSINGSLGVGATISGTVTAAQGGGALGGLRVEVLDAQGNVVAQSTTNPNGTYTLGDVPAGTWYLEFVGGRAYNGQLLRDRVLPRHEHARRISADQADGR